MPNQVFQVNCKSCNGMFVTENVQSAPLLRCPHCRSEAPPRQFHYMPISEPFDAGTDEGMPALLSAIEHMDDDSPIEREDSAPPETAPFHLKGKWLHFDCPHCQWPLRIKALEAEESLMDCGHCGLELIPPDPETGSRAELTRASARQLERISTADMRSVRLGKDQTLGKSVIARARKESPEKKETADDEDVALRSPAKVPKQAEKIVKRSVKPLAPEQIGRAFTPFEDQKILGGVGFELPEEERTEKEQILRLNHARIFRYVLIAAIVLLSGIALLLNSRMKDERKAAVAHAQQFEEKVALANAETRRLESMFDMARELAASDDWHAFLPKVRHRHRVEAIMEAYYSEHPHVPVDLVSFEKPVSIEIDGVMYEQMSVMTGGGKKRIVGFQHDPQGVTFDWEVFVDIADWEWAKFKKETSSDFTSLRVVAMRTSADDRYYRDADFSREDGMAVRIWLRDRADCFIAIMGKDSIIGQQVEHKCKWEIGKLVIADVAFPPAGETQLPDRIIVRRIVQDRWLYSSVD